MKKSLVFAMAMALGVTASAYAANPFSDVPAGHWAYGAVENLAAAGVVDGYGTTFGGDKLMTRYEMAQIVAKAMAKGAECEKLAAEFADELNALGVRVAKLEKKVDNVKITGQIRYSYRDAAGSDDPKPTGKGTKGYNRFRTRIFVNGAINDSWKYTGMLENDRYFNDVDSDTNTVTLKRAFLTGRIGGVKIAGGRKDFVQNDMIDAEADGIELKYGFGKVNLTGWMLRNVNGGFTTGGTEDGKGNYTSSMSDRDRVYMAKVDTKFGKLGAMIEYWAVDCTVKHNTWEVGLDYAFDKNWKLAGQWFRGSVDDDGLNWNNYGKNGWEWSLKYAGAKAAKPGSWGAWFTYMDRPCSTFIKPTAVGTYAFNNLAFGTDGKGSYGAWLGQEDGYKGFEIGANWAMAKNIVATARYYDLKGRDVNESQRKTLWGDVTFSF